MQNIPHDNEIVIRIKCYDGLPEDKYLAWVEGKEYRGLVVSANSIGECVKEIGTSLHALELYRKNIKPTTP